MIAFNQRERMMSTSIVGLVCLVFFAISQGVRDLKTFVASSIPFLALNVTTAIA
ncbi:MAG: hypothetical protein OSB69_08090 [Alphaproteobacteria bacterium]|nr:hypothetical protein [Alphaproteobacteria bacterium]